MSSILTPFLRDAFCAGILISLTFGLLGVYVVLRRVVFIGMTVAQVASAGTAFAFFLSGTLATTLSFLGSESWHHWGDIVCSSLFTLVAVAIISRRSPKKVVPSDAIVGLAFSAAWAAGILFVARSGQGIAEVRNLVQGDLLLICTYHLVIIGTVCAIVWLITMLTWKDQKLVAFDRDMATALGYDTRKWELAFYGLLGLAIVAGIRFAGLLLIFTYLVVPPIAGLCLAKSVEGMTLVSVLTSLIATIVGLIVSFQYDLPASPLITATCVLITVLVSTLSGWRSRG